LYATEEDILDFAKLDCRENKNNEEVDLNIIAQDIKKILSTELLTKQAYIIIENNLPTLLTSRTAFFLLFKNLIENGPKYNSSSNPEVIFRYYEAGENFRIDVE